MKLRLTERELALAARLRTALRETMAENPEAKVTAQELATALAMEPGLGMTPEMAHRVVRALMAKEPRLLT